MWGVGLRSITGPLQAKDSLVPPGWIEHPTSALPRMRSTTELRRRLTRIAAIANGALGGKQNRLTPRIGGPRLEAVAEPVKTDGKTAPAATDREARLAKALRANLKRRKTSKLASKPDKTS